MSNQLLGKYTKVFKVEADKSIEKAKIDFKFVSELPQSGY